MIDILFGLLNFGILVAVLTYAVRKSIAPQLREKIIGEHHDFVNLHDEHRHLTGEQKQLEDSIVVQEDYAKTLFKKINYWRNTVDLSTETELVEQTHLRHEADEKAEKQSRNYEIDAVYAEIAPRVVTSLKHELQEQFLDPQEGHAYLSQILKKL